MSANVESSVVSEVVSLVFKTMAGAEVSASSADAGFLPVAAVVGLTGTGKRMAVILRMSDALALHAARAMLQEPGLSWGPEVQDVVAELANVVAGNLKPHIAPGLGMSLPTVVHGSDFSLGSPRLSESHVGIFTCLGEPLNVTLAQEG